MVRIDDSGVQDVRLREAPIPWQAIASVHVMPRQQALLLFLWDKSYMKPRRLDFGFGPVSRLVLRDGDRVLDEQLTVTIPLSNLSPGVEDAWNFVKAHYRTCVCEPPGSNPFAVPAGQPLSWPLRSLFQKHVCAHADGLLMVRMGIVNLAAAVPLFTMDTMYPAVLRQPHEAIWFMLFPAMGLMSFLRWNRFYQPVRGSVDLAIGWSLQLLMATLPWYFLLT